jgi:hypothetical protein
VLGLLLCTVALTTSGCFLRLVLATVVVESISAEVDKIVGNVFGNVTAGVCRQDEVTGALDCTYTFQSEEFPNIPDQTSTATLLSEFGLFGVIVDPLILQLPAGVISVSGTVDDPADTNPAVPLVVTTATSFFTQPGAEIVPDSGHVFVIIDFPASIANILTTAGTNLTFTFNFEVQVPRGTFTTSFPVKAMFAGKVQIGGQTFYPPLWPCGSSFDSVPAVTIPIGRQVDLLIRILGALGQQNLGCNNVTYDYSSIGTAASLDHFQCYATRDSKGSVCSTKSSQNVGARCTLETDCGGVEDETDFCVPRGFPKGIQVSLKDQFETSRFNVTKPLALCNPADKNGEGIADPVTHLRSYQIGLAKGQPKHVPHAGVTVENQFHPAFGALLVDTIKPDRLLVPTARSLTQPVDEPDPSTHGVDHFKCYRVKPTKKTPRFTPIRGVTVVDEFNQPRVVDVTKPTRLCTPVDKNDEGIKNETNHLMCYEVKPVKQPRQPKHTKVLGIFVNNQLAPEQVDTTKPAELCVPSLKILP